MTTRSLCLRLAGVLTLLFPLAAAAVDAPATGEHHERNYDARATLTAGPERAPAASQLAAIEALRAALPDLAATFDPATGATRTLYNRTGYLTAGGARQDAEGIALDFVAANLDLLGLTPADLAGFEVTDSVFSAVTGATHLYLRQRHEGLPVYNGQLHVNVNRDGRILSVNNAFLPGLAEAVNTLEPTVGAGEAVAWAAHELGMGLASIPTEGEPTDPNGTVKVAAEGLSLDPIEARPMLLPIRAGEARLVWSFQIHTLDRLHWYDLTVDAQTGKVWTRIDWVADAEYRVYPVPVESPNHTTQLPPADGRELVVDPQNAATNASPNGWHDTGAASFTTMQGNNVHAFEDSDGNGAPPATEPDCGASLSCDFPLDLTQAPSTYAAAAVANLFYWNNVIHDVQYQYGFDEAAGNFQENNFGNGGTGSDSVNAHAQSGFAFCPNNAFFSTPADGSNPTMEMCIWTAPNPDLDGDFDNGIVIHEFGHGISNRQVGGPANVSCLGNSQQPGEGWSDWHALVYTHEPGDQGTDKRGIGTYALNQPTTGDGIRTQPYSTDPALNDHTYESIQGMSIPHGVGEVWAQGIWEVYWALVDQHGFDPDLYDLAAGAGNHRALLYINEGFKNTACSPTFTDARDGIIQAATDSFGAEDVCLLWEAFAAFGLGADAVSGGSGSTNPTNGFEVPLACQCSPAPIADAGPDQTICLGDSTTVGTPAQPDNTYSWSPGGETTAQITVSPAVTTTYTVTATTSCGSAQDSATVTVDDGTGAGLSEDFEAGSAGWTSGGLWHLANPAACAAPNPGGGSQSFYYGQDSTCTYDTGGANSGDLTSPSIFGLDASSTLSFDYYRVVESFSGDFDRTTVDIVSGSGTTTVFSLNSSNPSTAAWASSGPIDLSAFAGQTIQVRFRFDSVDSVANAFTGWLIDDVVVTGSSSCTPGNTPPEVTITAPDDGSSFPEGTSIDFAATAIDAEDGALTPSWTSDLDGNLGSGSFLSAVLSVGTHTVTASATDSGSLTGSDSITVTVTASNPPVTATFTSVGGHDGWTRESNETSGVGGGSNSTGSGRRPIRAGDTTQDRQWRSIVSFDTASIPDGATVLSATLRLRRGRLTGSNPFTSGFGSCFVDVQSGGFGGNVSLANGDFQAAATASQAATLSNAPSDGDFSEGSLDAAGLAAVNLTGFTQMRVYFEVDDNDDGGNDYMGYYSGDHGNAANHPQLVVTYQE